MEIMIVMTIIGLLASIAIPNFMRARNTVQQNLCINNMSRIDDAIVQWLVENKKSDTEVPTSDQVQVYIKNNIFPNCPSGGAYRIQLTPSGHGSFVWCSLTNGNFPHYVP
jgi:type II secretory pathway pseudopilin PulG